MRKTLFAVLMVVLLSMTACGKSELEQEIIAGMTGCGATDSDNAEQPVAEITEAQDTAEQDTAEQVSEDATVSEESTTSEPEMTQVYLLSKYTCYDTNCEVLITNEYEYDEYGYRTKNVHGGDVYEDLETEYDANGNQIKYVSYQDGVVDEWKEYEYEYDANGNTTRWAEYDAAGNEIKCILLKEDGTDDYSTEYEYDANGNVIRETLYDVDGAFSQHKYEYDTNGNKTKRPIFSCMQIL